MTSQQRTLRQAMNHEAFARQHMMTPAQTERSAPIGGRYLIHSDPGARDRARLVHATVEVRSALVEAAAAATAAAERARTMAAVLEEALAVLAATEGAAALAASPVDEVTRRVGDLSPREREVLELVAEGRTNKDIAKALFVSPNTVKTHVASLLTKLRADTRVQLATIAARQALR